MQKMPSVLRKQSCGSVTVFWLDREAARERIRSAARRLAAEVPDVRSVHLFGSLARDRAVPGSDADILIVLASSDRRWMDRSEPLQPYFESCGIPVDLFCYTEAETLSIPLAERALREGFCLTRREEDPPPAGAGTAPPHAEVGNEPEGRER